MGAPGRLALKRKDGNAADDEGRKRPSAEQAQKPQQPAPQPSASTRAAGFDAEAAEQLAAAAAAAATEQEAAAPMSGGALGSDEDAAAPVDKEARQGLLKVVESMRRRADDGHVQLLRQRRLLEQKQGLAARGEAVLAHHAAATWQQQQPLPALAPGAVAVHSLQAHCVAGQWWLAAALSMPAEWQRLHAGGAVTATLLAASPACGLVCRQQQCTTSSSGSDSSGDSGSSSAAGAAVQLHLTALLDAQQQQPQPLHAAGTAWADVFLLLESASTAAGGTAAAAAAAAAATAPPVQLGRVQLSRQQWLSSYSTGPDSAQQQQQQLPSPPPAARLSRALAVEARQLDLRCLHSIVQQQLACVASSGSSDGTAAPQRHSYALPCSATAGVPAATVHVTQYSARFAQVELQASSAAMLDALQQQLVAGLRQAAAAAGAPPDDATLAPCLLAPGQAGAAVDAADALVRELDASIEWVEALLKERLALDSQAWRQRPPPDPAATRQAQAAALAAAAATDGRLLQLMA